MPIKACRISLSTEILKEYVSRRTTGTLMVYIWSGTVGASKSVTRRVLAETVYVIYYEVWAVFILEYDLEG